MRRVLVGSVPRRETKGDGGGTGEEKGKNVTECEDEEYGR